jgi:hypothetical protein
MASRMGDVVLAGAVIACVLWLALASSVAALLTSLVVAAVASLRFTSWLVGDVEELDDGPAEEDASASAPTYARSVGM